MSGSDKRRYARVTTDLPMHPKIQGCEYPNEALALYVCGLLFCMEYMTDGFIPRKTVSRLLPSDLGEKITARLVCGLVECGLWGENDDGYSVHDYLTHQMSKASIEAMREGGRKGGLKGGLKPFGRVPRSNKEEDKDKDINHLSDKSDGVGKKQESYSEDFCAFWKDYPRKEDKRAAYRAWKKAVKLAPPSEIIAAVATYKQSRKVRDGYIKLPTSWLNAGAWEDEFVPFSADDDDDFEGWQHLGVGR